jgi:hypothetical protein
VHNNIQGRPLALSGSMRTPTAFLAGIAVGVPVLFVIIAAFVTRPEMRAALIPGFVLLSIAAFAWSFWMLRSRRRAAGRRLPDRARMDCHAADSARRPSSPNLCKLWILKQTANCGPYCALGHESARIDRRLVPLA